MDETEENVCRICLDVGSEEMPLVRPCLCDGTSAFVHSECLEAWLTEQHRGMAGKERCDTCKARFHWEKMHSPNAPKDGLPWFMIPFALLPMGTGLGTFFVWHSVRGVLLQVLLMVARTIIMGLAALFLDLSVPNFIGHGIPSQLGLKEESPLVSMLAPPPIPFDPDAPRADFIALLARIASLLTTVLVCTFFMDCAISLAGVIVERAASRQRRYLLGQLPYYGSFDDLSRQNQKGLVRSILYFELSTLNKVQRRIKHLLTQQKVEKEEEEAKERRAAFKAAKEAIDAWLLREQHHRRKRVRERSSLQLESRPLIDARAADARRMLGPGAGMGVGVGRLASLDALGDEETDGGASAPQGLASANRGTEGHGKSSQKMSPVASRSVSGSALDWLVHTWNRWFGFRTAADATAQRIERIVKKTTELGMPRLVAFRAEAMVRVLWQMQFAFVDGRDIVDLEDIGVAIGKAIVGCAVSVATACWSLAVFSLLVIAGQHTAIAIRDRSFLPMLLPSEIPRYLVSTTPSNLIDGTGVTVMSSNHQHMALQAVVGVATSSWQDRYTWHIAGDPSSEAPLPGPQLPRNMSILDSWGGNWVLQHWKNQQASASSELFHPLSPAIFPLHWSELSRPKPNGTGDKTRGWAGRDYVPLPFGTIDQHFRAPLSSFKFHAASSLGVVSAQHYLGYFESSMAEIYLMQAGAAAAIDPWIPAVAENSTDASAVQVCIGGHLIDVGTLGRWQRELDQAEQALNGSAGFSDRLLSIKPALVESPGFYNLTSGNATLLSDCLLRLHCELAQVCDISAISMLKSTCSETTERSRQVYQGLLHSFAGGLRDGKLYATLGSYLAPKATTSREGISRNETLAADSDLVLLPFQPEELQLTNQNNSADMWLPQNGTLTRSLQASAQTIALSNRVGLQLQRPTWFPVGLKSTASWTIRCFLYLYRIPRRMLEEIVDLGPRRVVSGKAEATGGGVASRVVTKRDSSREMWKTLSSIWDYVIRFEKHHSIWMIPLRLDLWIFAFLGVIQIGVVFAAFYAVACVAGLIIPSQLLVLMDQAPALHKLRIKDALRHTFLVCPQAKLLEPTNVIESLLGWPWRYAAVIGQAMLLSVWYQVCLPIAASFIVAFALRASGTEVSGGDELAGNVVLAIMTDPYTFAVSVLWGHVWISMAHMALKSVHDLIREDLSAWIVLMPVSALHSCNRSLRKPPSKHCQGSVTTLFAIAAATAGVIAVPAWVAHRSRMPSVPVEQAVTEMRSHTFSSILTWNSDQQSPGVWENVQKVHADAGLPSTATGGVSSPPVSVDSVLRPLHYAVLLLPAARHSQTSKNAGGASFEDSRIASDVLDSDGIVAMYAIWSEEPVGRPFETAGQRSEGIYDPLRASFQDVQQLQAFPWVDLLGMRVASTQSSDGAGPRFQTTIPLAMAAPVDSMKSNETAAKTGLCAATRYVSHYLGHATVPTDPIHPISSRTDVSLQRGQMVAEGRRAIAVPPMIDWQQLENQLGGSQEDGSKSRHYGLLNVDTFVPPFLRTAYAEHIPYWYPARVLLSGTATNRSNSGAGVNQTELALVRAELKAVVALARKHYGDMFRRSSGAAAEREGWKALSLDVHPSTRQLESLEMVAARGSRLFSDMKRGFELLLRSVSNAAEGKHEPQHDRNTPNGTQGASGIHNRRQKPKSEIDSAIDVLLALVSGFDDVRYMLSATSFLRQKLASAGVRSDPGRSKLRFSGLSTEDWQNYLVPAALTDPRWDGCDHKDGTGHQVPPSSRQAECRPRDFHGWSQVERARSEGQDPPPASVLSRKLLHRGRSIAGRAASAIANDLLAQSEAYTGASLAKTLLSTPADFIDAINDATEHAIKPSITLRDVARGLQSQAAAVAPAVRCLVQTRKNSDHACWKKSQGSALPTRRSIRPMRLARRTEGVLQGTSRAALSSGVSNNNVGDGIIGVVSRPLLPNEAWSAVELEIRRFLSSGRDSSTYLGTSRIFIPGTWRIHGRPAVAAQLPMLFNKSLESTVKRPAKVLAAFNGSSMHYPFVTPGGLNSSHFVISQDGFSQAVLALGSAASKRTDAVQRAVAIRGKILVDIPVGGTRVAKKKPKQVPQSTPEASTRSPTGRESEESVSPRMNTTDSVHATLDVWTAKKQDMLNDLLGCSKSPLSDAAGSDQIQSTFRGAPMCHAGKLQYGQHLAKGHCLSRLQTLRQIAGEGVPIIVPMPEPDLETSEKVQPRSRTSALLYGLYALFAWLVTTIAVTADFLASMEVIEPVKSIVGPILAAGHFVQPKVEWAQSYRSDPGLALAAPIAILLALWLSPGVSMAIHSIVHFLLELFGKAFCVQDVILPPVNVLRARMPEVVVQYPKVSEGSGISNETADGTFAADRTLPPEAVDGIARLDREVKGGRIRSFLHSKVPHSKGHWLVSRSRKESRVLQEQRQVETDAAEATDGVEIRVPAASIETSVYGTMNRLSKNLIDIERRKLLQELALRPRSFRQQILESDVRKTPLQLRYGQMIRARRLSSSHDPTPGVVKDSLLDVPGRKSIKKTDPMLVDVVIGRNLVRGWFRHLRAPGRTILGIRESCRFDYAARESPKLPVHGYSEKRAKRFATKALRSLAQLKDALPAPHRGTPAAYYQPFDAATPGTLLPTDPLAADQLDSHAEMPIAGHSHECSLNATTGAESEALETVFAVAASGELRKRRLDRANRLAAAKARGQRRRRRMDISSSSDSEPGGLDNILAGAADKRAKSKATSSVAAMASTKPGPKAGSSAEGKPKRRKDKHRRWKHPTVGGGAHDLSSEDSFIGGTLAGPRRQQYRVPASNTLDSSLDLNFAELCKADPLSRLPSSGTYDFYSMGMGTSKVDVATLGRRDWSAEDTGVSEDAPEDYDCGDAVPFSKAASIHGIPLLARRGDKRRRKKSKKSRLDTKATGSLKGKGNIMLRHKAGPETGGKAPVAHGPNSPGSDEGEKAASEEKEGTEPAVQPGDNEKEQEHSDDDEDEPDDDQVVEEGCLSSTLRRALEIGVFAISLPIITVWVLYDLLLGNGEGPPDQPDQQAIGPDPGAEQEGNGRLQGAEIAEGADQQPQGPARQLDQAAQRAMLAEAVRRLQLRPQDAQAVRAALADLNGQMDPGRERGPRYTYKGRRLSAGDWPSDLESEPGDDQSDGGGEEKASASDDGNAADQDTTARPDPQIPTSPADQHSEGAVAETRSANFSGGAIGVTPHVESEATSAATSGASAAAPSGVDSDDQKARVKTTEEVRQPPSGTGRIGKGNGTSRDRTGDSSTKEANPDATNSKSATRSLPRAKVQQRSKHSVLLERIEPMSGLNAARPYLRSKAVLQAPAWQRELYMHYVQRQSLLRTLYGAVDTLDLMWDGHFKGKYSLADYSEAEDELLHGLRGVDELQSDSDRAEVSDVGQNPNGSAALGKKAEDTSRGHYTSTSARLLQKVVSRQCELDTVARASAIPVHPPVSKSKTFWKAKSSAAAKRRERRQLARQRREAGRQAQNAIAAQDREAAGGGGDEDWNEAGDDEDMAWAGLSDDADEDAGAGAAPEAHDQATNSSADEHAEGTAELSGSSGGGGNSTDPIGNAEAGLAEHDHDGHARPLDEVDEGQASEEDERQEGDDGADSDHDGDVYAGEPQPDLDAIQDEGLGGGLMGMEAVGFNRRSDDDDDDDVKSGGIASEDSLHEGWHEPMDELMQFPPPLAQWQDVPFDDQPAIDGVAAPEAPGGDGSDDSSSADSVPSPPTPRSTTESSDHGDDAQGSEGNESQWQSEELQTPGVPDIDSGSQEGSETDYDAGQADPPLPLSTRLDSRVSAGIDGMSLPSIRSPSPGEDRDGSEPEVVGAMPSTWNAQLGLDGANESSNFGASLPPPMSITRELLDRGQARYRPLGEPALAPTQNPRWYYVPSQLERAVDRSFPRKKRPENDPRDGDWKHRVPNGGMPTRISQMPSGLLARVALKVERELRQSRQSIHSRSTAHRTRAAAAQADPSDLFWVVIRQSVRNCIMIPLMIACVALLAPAAGGLLLFTLQTVGRLSLIALGTLCPEDEDIQPFDAVVGAVVLTAVSRCIYDIVFCVSLAVGSWARRLSFQCLLKQRGLCLCCTRACLACCWPCIERLWMRSLKNQLLVHFGLRPPRSMSTFRCTFMLIQAVMLLVVLPWAIGATIIRLQWQDNLLAVLSFSNHGFESPYVQTAWDKLLGRLPSIWAQNSTNAGLPLDATWLNADTLMQVPFYFFDADTVGTIATWLARLAAVSLAWALGTVIVYILALPGILPVMDVMYLRSIEIELMVVAALSLAALLWIWNKGSVDLQSIGGPPAVVPQPLEPIHLPMPNVSVNDTLTEEHGNSTEVTVQLSSIGAGASSPRWHMQSAFEMIGPFGVFASEVWGHVIRYDVSSQLGPAVTHWLAAADGLKVPEIGDAAWDVAPFGRILATIVGALRLMARLLYSLVVYATAVLLIRYLFQRQLKHLHDYLYDQVYLVGRKVKEMPPKARQWLKDHMRADGRQVMQWSGPASLH